MPLSASPPPGSAPSTRPSGPAVLLALLLGACGDEGSFLDGDFARDLLAQRPDRILDQPGRLVADAETGWGERAVSGWKPAERHADAGPFVATTGGSGKLRLAATGGGEELVVRAWSPGAAAEPRAATVLLNDVALGRLALGAEPFEHRLEVPVALWNAGDNLLELRTEEPEHELAVASLAYGAPVQVDWEDAPPRLFLDPSGSAVYRVETGTAGVLAVQGEVSAPGTLEVGFTAFDPATGARSGASSPHRVATEGRFQTAVSLPSAGEGVLELEVSFVDADPGAILTLTRLALEDEGFTDRPPIVFVSIDTLAATHMSVYGYERDTTPRLAELAAESVVFERCSTNASWTLPSYLSVFSGLYPGSHFLPGAGEGHGYDLPFWRMGESRWTMAEALHAAGYRTAGIVDSPWLDPRCGIAQGYDHYDMSPTFIPVEDHEGGILEVTRLALDWMDTVPAGHPFFTFLQAIDPHAPYLPREEYRGRFGSDEETEPYVAAGAMLHSYGALTTAECQLLLKQDETGPERLSLAACIASYDEEIRMTDEIVGRFLDELRERGILDRAIFVFHSDHGEAFLQHDKVGHGQLYESVARVPLIIRFPKGQYGGTRVTQSVQSVDILPTLLDYVGLGAGRDYLPGRSLIPLADGQETAPVATFVGLGLMDQSAVELDGWKLIAKKPHRYSALPTMVTSPHLSEAWRAEHLPELVGEKRLTKELYAGIVERFGGEEALRTALEEQLGALVFELYDLEADPAERTDLAAERSDMVGKLAAEILRLTERADTQRVSLEELRAAPVLTEDQTEELRKLGYL